MSILVLCKFTPLGFETFRRFRFKNPGFGVNLPRWGLKRAGAGRQALPARSVNLPRWGLKHAD